ncbi:MAG: hypothetical protein ACLQQ4_01875 [Bacteroidia bacterium]
MKLLKHLFLSCFSLLYLASVAGNTPITNKVTQTDTLMVRLNNKPYYAIKTNGELPIYNGQITFNPLKITDTGSVTLKCLDAKSQLIKMMRNGDTIQDYFFANIRLSFTDFTDEVQKKKAASNVFSSRIIFYNCVFGHITADTVEDLYVEDTKEKKRIEFKQDVLFINCNFLHGLELSNCIFDKKFFITGQLLGQHPSVIENSDFRDDSYIFATPPDGFKAATSLNINLCRFYAPVILSIINNDKSKVVIERCKFTDVLSLGKSITPNIFARYHEASKGLHYITRIYNYSSYYADFLKKKYLAEYYCTDDTIEQFTHNTRKLYNLTIRQCQGKYVDIANTNLANCSLEDLSVSRCIDITSCNLSYTSDYAGKIGLEDLNFPNNNCIIYANYKSFSPDAFRLNNYLQKIEIHPLVHNFFDTTANFVEDNDNYYNLIKDYSVKHFTNQDLVTGIKARFDREKSLWLLEYHAAHFKHGVSFGDRLANFFPWVGGHFLEITVSSGYKGEWKFAIWVILIILTFTCIYYFRHKDAVIDYLNSKFNKELSDIHIYNTLKIYGSHNVYRDFARCLWFSAMVFVDPRLPISFFNLRSGFFGLVLTEWIFGLTAILLFLIFLASNYSFIRALIGI